MTRLGAWFRQGERVPVQTERDTYHLFVRAAGADTSPWTTFFHGYPSCSWDWVKLEAQVHAWEDVGHYPQIEVPERVAEVIAEAEGEGEVASAQSRSTAQKT